MKIGILQTGQAPDVLRSELGDYPAMFERLLAKGNFTFQTWHVEGMDFPASVHDADGWLITGSRHGVYEPHDFIAPLEQFIRDAFGAELPVAGICFGHQIMAQALGGQVGKFQGGWAVGAQEYDFEGKALTLNAWHQDQVLTPPHGARIIAQNDFCRYAGLSYSDHAYSVQAHPEFSDSFIQGLMDTRGKGVVPEPLLEQARAAQGGPRDSDIIADQIVALFQHHDRKRSSAPSA